MIPSLAGETIEVARVDFALRLWTDSWQLDLGGQLPFQDDGHADAVIDGDVQAEELPEPVSRLLGRRITRLSVSSSGDLTLELDAATLTCLADPDAEAWQLYGPKGEIIVCGPGGRLTEWGPRRD